MGNPSRLSTVRKLARETHYQQKMVILRNIRMLPSKHRLRDNHDFRHVYSRGRSYVHPMVVLYVMLRDSMADPQSQSHRVGFVVSKKQGNAVVRNRIKRRLREAFRIHQGSIRDGLFDLVFVARSPLKNSDWLAVQAALQSLLKRADLFQSVTGSISKH